MPPPSGAVKVAADPSEQLVDAIAGEAIVIALGKVLVNASPDTGMPVGFVISNLRVLMLPGPIMLGVNVPVIDGAEVCELADILNNNMVASTNDLSMRSGPIEVRALEVLRIEIIERHLERFVFVIVSA